ncbi:MAG: c-type cytochrome [Gammaproteobacteria bacterium]|nr:c-type cytochrome [Gammaproteobacteria bacterium]
MIKMMKELFTIVGFVALLFSSSATAQGIDRGALLATMCVTCHGPGGQGSKRIPSIDNHSDHELAEYMHGFKEGTERATIMDRHASFYSDEEINLLAKYFYEAKQ